MDSAPATRDLAICIDDVGQHALIDAAARRLATAGRLSAASCLVYGPSSRAAAAALRDSDAVDLGLHLDLTEPWGRRRFRRPWASLLVEAWSSALDTTRLRDEIRTQLDLFERLYGRTPDHVDGHRHVHQLPGVRDCLTAELAARGSAAGPWLRCNRPAQASPVGSKRWAVAFGSRQLAAAAVRHGLPHNQRLLGVHVFRDDDVSYGRRVQQWLQIARSGDLLMCHAAIAPVPGDAIAASRLVEYRVLASPTFGEALARAGVRISRLSATLRRTAASNGTAR